MTDAQLIGIFFFGVFFSSAVIYAALCGAADD